MSPQEWLAVMRREYLVDYVPGGGAAVKFAVSTTNDGRAELRDGLHAAADELGFQFAFVDAAQARLHLVDKLFHAVAQQIDWDALARAHLERLLRVRGLRLPPPPASLSLSRLAELNAAHEVFLRSELTRTVQNELFDDQAMSREFRLAMIQLCLAQLDPTDNPTLEQAVKAWLRGELRLVSELKRAFIFQQIGRHNARHMLFSLAHWLTRVGKSGLVLALDVARYADAVRPAERGAGYYYSLSATMDLYEMLRQLVDATDEARFCFAAVLAGPAFLQDDRRGVRGYQALYFRIWDEVHDRHRENPLSSLARIAAVA